ncbi:Conserved hypothetical protein [Candidatus Phytoplasma australiense]|uniref:Sequence-variable mosaic (SVM) signal sequence domain-containing protein n=1 Tax=Phytoplasma australiense TaxID=59748 RepID=B1VA30_PHYAS|nr:Conserved hypothetical protein [Candidatus Phytoplasma australiense]
MFKLQNQLKIISICLLAFLGMLLINNNQVMAMAIVKNEETISKNNNMQIHGFYLEKEEDILNYLINKNCYECFSFLTLEYPCYNGENVKYDLNCRIKNPPVVQLGYNNYSLMCVIFDKGIRDKKDDFYSLENLEKMSNGASNMYIFWLKQQTFTLNSIIEKQKHIKDINQRIFYRLEIEFQKNKIEKIKHKLNLLQKEKNDLINQIKSEKNYFKSQLETKKLEILKIQIQKDNLENSLKLKQQELLDNQKLTEIEKTNLKKEIKNIKINLDNEIKENLIKNKKIEELNTQLNLLNIKFQNEKTKYQQIKENLEKKHNDYLGIFDFLYKKIFQF